jgi:hypothetical protein
LAIALQEAGDLPAAKRHALLALDETPRFRAAHARLLEIVRAIEQNSGNQPSSPAPPDNTPTENQ